jgi:hypothetical protein
MHLRRDDSVSQLNLDGILDFSPMPKTVFQTYLGEQRATLRLWDAHVVELAL